MDFKNIKMIGIGKGGSNLVSRLSGSVFTNMSAAAISTNSSDLEKLSLKEKILILKDPKETKSQVIRLRKSIHSYSCILIFVQFGSDTSAYLASALANISKDMNIESIAICSIAQKLDKYATVSINKLKEHCKNILWLPNDMTVSEMFSQSDILNSLAYISNIDKQNASAIKEKEPVKHKSFIDRIIRRKTKKDTEISSGEILTQEEFGFNTLAEQRGYFSDTARNMYNGVDLDIPTYLRKNLKIQI